MLTSSVEKHNSFWLTDLQAKQVPYRHGRFTLEECEFLLEAQTFESTVDSVWMEPDAFEAADKRHAKAF